MRAPVNTAAPVNDLRLGGGAGADLHGGHVDGRADAVGDGAVVHSGMCGRAGLGWVVHGAGRRRRKTDHRARDGVQRRHGVEGLGADGGGAPVGPVNTAAPVVNDLCPAVGQSLTYTPGTWTGAPAPSVTAQWCTVGGGWLVRGSGPVHGAGRRRRQADHRAGDGGQRRWHGDEGLGADGGGAAGGAGRTRWPRRSATSRRRWARCSTYTAGTWTGAPTPTVTAQWCTPGCAAVLGTGGVVHGQGRRPREADHRAGDGGPHRRHGDAGLGPDGGGCLPWGP